MLDNASGKSSRDEVTDPQAFFSRRNFMRGGILAATTMASGMVYRAINHAREGVSTQTPLLTPDTSSNGGYIPATQAIGAAQLRPDESLTTYEAITNFNNFYEFSLDKAEVAQLCGNFRASPWTVSVGGLCRNPTTFDIGDLRKISPLEERIYRMRCVERWSMVIPWNGYSISKLLERVEPLSSAKYVAFTSAVDPKQFPNQRPGSEVDLGWPYVEGLRMDEAMHPLAILVFGVYGRELPAQDGAPVRLAVPWKYGFKGAKSLVKIELVEEVPPSTWNKQASNEYGFYANVNPNHDHPRWSQTNETRIISPEIRRFQPTQMFNGYGEQVARLYTGMDLDKYF